MGAAARSPGLQSAILGKLSTWFAVQHRRVDLALKGKLQSPGLTCLTPVISPGPDRHRADHNDLVAVINDLLHVVDKKLALAVEIEAPMKSRLCVVAKVLNAQL
jgi:hypothetical protein